MAATGKTVFFCTECGTDSPKWFGKCPACGAWNTCREESMVTGKSSKTAKQAIVSSLDPTEPVAIRDISNAKEQRIMLPFAEMNRVLGGGLVPGSSILVGGEPGIGKSTLLATLPTIIIILSLRIGKQNSARWRM